MQPNSDPHKHEQLKNKERLISLVASRSKAIGVTVGAGKGIGMGAEFLKMQSLITVHVHSYCWSLHVFPSSQQCLQ